MSFNCVSKYGLVGGGVFLPYDVQADRGYLVAYAVSRDVW